LAFERNLVGWPDGMPMQLEKPIVLEDALSDLPEVSNNLRDSIPSWPYCTLSAVELALP